MYRIFNRKDIITLCVLTLSTHSVFSQSNPQKTPFTSTKRIVRITSTNNLTNNIVDSSEIHAPDGSKKNGGVNQLKKNIVFPTQKTTYEQNITSTPSPYILKSYQINQQYVNAIDSLIPIQGGTPLDNTLAISNDGLLMTAINSKIVAYDTHKDSSLYQFTSNNLTLSLSQFAMDDTINTYYPFDPKLIYDPIHDRFILTFLSGFDPSNSKIVVGFSTSNNPKDPWNVYEIDGNPRNTTAWTDYPAVSLTKNHLFISVNLILADSSWQAGFDGSILWQLPLTSCYQGSENISFTLWDNIKFNNKYIRNLCPVQGGIMPLKNEAFFLSNRNFDLINDTIFLIHIKNTDDTSTANLTISALKLNTSYGLPPNGLQEDTDLNDPSSGLQTNDARWLGAFIIQDQIQFVGNSNHFGTQKASIYHGKIQGVRSQNPIATGYIITDQLLDYAYPNIAFTGNDSCEIQSIIAFDHSSINDYAGISCVYHSNSGEYSSVYRIKNGLNYIDNPPLQYDPYERWGDYFGLQRKYNEPGKVWSAGFFGLANKRSSVHVAELLSPDTSIFKIHIDEILSDQNLCEKVLFISPENGITPYAYQINDSLLTSNSFSFNTCEPSQRIIYAFDAKGCRATDTLFAENNPTIDALLFPNPTKNQAILSFYSQTSKNYLLQITDVKGKIIHQKKIFSFKGPNQIIVQLENMSAGIYQTTVLEENGLHIFNQTLIKTE